MTTSNTDNFWDKENQPKADWGPYEYNVKKQCQSCFKWFETTDRWAQRCPKCKKANSPKRKQISNVDFKSSPF